MYKEKTVGILYSAKLPLEVTAEGAAAGIRRETGLAETRIKAICADTLQESDLKNVDVLVNLLGPYYPECGWRAILHYYKDGGIVMNVGIRPFSIPYCVREGVARVYPETAEAYHTLGFIDEYVTVSHESQDMEQKMELKICSPRYRFLAQLYEAGQFPAMRRVCSIQYALTQTCIPSKKWWIDEESEIDSYLECACEWRDRSGRVVSVPITRVDHRSHGAMVFLNFTPIEKDYYHTDAGQRLLGGMVRTCLAERLHLEFWTDYPRYYEDETPKLNISLKALGRGKRELPKLTLQYRISRASAGEAAQEITQKDAEMTDGLYEAVLEADNAGEDFYQALVSVYADGEFLTEKHIGFYIISKKAILEEAGRFKPVVVDPERSADFCLRDDKIFAIHGTTYFVTDNYRRCYDKFNAYQCDADLRLLKGMGFNVIRSGFWTPYRYVFTEEGELHEKTLRILEAFFLTAARNGLAVQFVLGTFIFNPWDRDKCPIHNPEMREKVIRVFASFAERFRGWKNVQVDAINEPSYSVKGLWSTGRPSGDPYERENWIAWLRRKYDNDVVSLRRAWGIPGSAAAAFEELDLPDKDAFFRSFYGKPSTIYVNYGALSDFYAFARESYSRWLSCLRREIKDRDPNMLFMVGRDESLRVPAQQDEAYGGNIDMVNWHQWNGDGFVFSEYALNRVRGLPCCGQELGVYHFNDLRGGMRLTEEEYCAVLERKLLYTFGNWIQWQSFSDPTMLGFNEITLGLFRADRSETPYADMTRRLAWLEQKISPWLSGRNEDTTQILTIHPSTVYYSMDQPLAVQGIQTSIQCMNYYVKLQSDMVLEHLFRKDNLSQMGAPKLIVFPVALAVSGAAWQLLTEYMEGGTAVLLSGYADIDEYWRPAERFKAMGIAAKLRNICGSERIRIGGETYVVSFRRCVGNGDAGRLLSKAVFPGESGNMVRTFPVGKGKLIHCPIPLELGDSEEAVAALYRYAAREAGVTNPICRIHETKNKQNLLLYPASYRECTVYTLVNEGDADSIRFTDLASGVEVEMRTKALRGSKICLDKKGRLIGGYISGDLKVGGQEIPAGKGLCFYDGEGQRESCL